MSELFDLLTKARWISGLVVFSGKSGSGKTSLMNNIIDRYDGMELPITWCGEPQRLRIRKAKKYTTRGQRPDDDPDEFIYVSGDKFKGLVEGSWIVTQYKSSGAGDVLYGWSDGELRPGIGQIVFATVNDEAGAKDLKYMSGSTNVFVDVPDAVLFDRIRKRGGSHEAIEDRIQRLSAEHITPSYDKHGNTKPIGMAEHFYGTSDQIEGIADIVVENCGDIGLAADAVFAEIIRIGGNRGNPLNKSEQRKLRIYNKDGKDVVETSVISPEDYVRPSGASFNRGQLVETDRPGYDSIVTLGAVRGAISGLQKPRYYIRICGPEEEIDGHSERRAMFGGGILRPLETWGIPEGTDTINLLYGRSSNAGGLAAIGMRTTPIKAGSDMGDTPQAKALYFDGTASYRDIRNVFEANRLRRLV